MHLLTYAIAANLSLLAFRILGCRRVLPYALSAATVPLVKVLGDSDYMRLNKDYDLSIKEMGLTDFEERTVNIMHQVRASHLIIEKYEADNLSRLRHKVGKQSNRQ